MVDNDPDIKTLGIDDKTDLLRSVMANFIERYEKNDDFINAKNNARPTKIDVDDINTTSNKNMNSQEAVDYARALLRNLRKHLEEKDCKHTLKQILKEGLRDSEKGLHDSE